MANDPVSRPEVDDVILTGVAGMTVAKCCRSCGALLFPYEASEGQPTAVERHRTWHGAWALLLVDAQGRGVPGV